MPVVSLEQRIRFAILCARAVYREPGWCAWAEAWLTGADRTAAAARLSLASLISAYSAPIAATEAALSAALITIDAVGIDGITEAMVVAAAAIDAAAAAAYHSVPPVPLELAALAKYACST